jgi:hypothetical protein
MAGLTMGDSCLDYHQQIDVDPDINPDDYANPQAISSDDDQSDDGGYTSDPDDDQAS